MQCLQCQHEPPDGYQDLSWRLCERGAYESWQCKVERMVLIGQPQWQLISKKRTPQHAALAARNDLFGFDTGRRQVAEKPSRRSGVKHEGIDRRGPGTMGSGVDYPEAAGAGHTQELLRDML